MPQKRLSPMLFYFAQKCKLWKLFCFDFDVAGEGFDAGGGGVV